MSRSNVLVVEDDQTIRQLLVDYLHEQSGLDVDGARDGADALHQVATKSYAVVVLDVIMPYMSGIDFLDSLQALLSDPSVKSLDVSPAVLIVTSVPQDVMSDSEIELRFPSIVRGVLRKPVDPCLLARRVEELL